MTLSSPSRVREMALAVAIVAVAALLRFVATPGVPTGLNQDEAVAVYDAYSVLRTGRDHHGAHLPLVFRAYNDWIPPVHTYAAIPFVATFGPTPLAIRLLSAVVGTVTVAGAYVLGRAL